MTATLLRPMLATSLSVLLLSAAGYGEAGSQPETSGEQAQDPAMDRGNPPTVVAAGDISGPVIGAQMDTSEQVIRMSPTRVLTLGDHQYPRASLPDFTSFYRPTWGRFKAKTRPSPGDHEYKAATAAGYFTYFGALARPYGRSFYSFNLGQWHIVSLNSNISTAAGSVQGTWLRQNLAATKKRCILAYWHQPRFSSGKNGNSLNVSPFWTPLYGRRADIVLNGDAHSYERFARQTPGGAASRQGIREFVVGTGGIGTSSFGTVKPNSQKRITGLYGVLRLTLRPASYEWRFVAASGRVLDRGGPVRCH